MSAYVRGRRRYRDGEQLDACACAAERGGWLDARDQQREDAFEPEHREEDPSEY